MHFYNKYPTHFIAVDCVIFGYRDGELCLLLYPRSFEPAKGQWSLLGGFVQDAESADGAAKRILKQTTGLGEIFLEQVQAFTEVNRDPQARVISLAYYALIRIGEQDESCVREHGAHWWPITAIPQMIFDHREMVDMALVKLQQKAGFSLVGKAMLPEQFTLMHLLKLYEAIFQKTFDPPNFRKKILSLNALERLDVKDFSDSRKGAYYYRCKNDVIAEGLDRIVKI